jgi:hypothetical protein
VAKSRAAQSKIPIAATLASMKLSPVSGSTVPSIGWTQASPVIEFYHVPGTLRE